MNRKGYGIFGFAILFIFLIIMWALFLGRFFGMAGDIAVQNGATGMDAFFWNNLNLWIFLTFVVVAIIYIRMGSDT